MERDELRTTLVNHLETLRRNLQVVSMEVLKTKYKKPFDALRQDICKAATAYTRFLVFDGMRIKHKYFDEAVPYIDTAVKQTKRLKQISDATFQRQDIDEIESLALALRKEIEAALQPFYMGHMCLYVTPECFDDPPKTPEVYNDATACVWRDGTWQLLEDTSKGFLLFVQSKFKEEAEKDISAISKQRSTRLSHGGQSLQAFAQRLGAHPRQAQAAHRKGSRRPRGRI